MSAPAAAAPADSTQLYLSNLPFSADNDALKAWVEKSANVQVVDATVSMRRSKNGPRSRGQGFVRVAAGSADAVLALKGQEMEGREIDVQVARPKEKKEPKPKKEKQQPAEGAAPANGEAPAAKKKRRNRRRRPAGGASGEGAAPSSSSAPAASSSSSSSRRQTTVPAPGHTLLYVNNLSFDATTEDVSNLFAQHLGGQAPTQVELVEAKFGRFKGRSRGFGFVVVKDDQVDQALKLAGTNFQGRDIGVSVARDKKDAAAESASPAAAAQ